ncbi:MAG: hypothetical protein FVQ79_13930, partial [Planctomycetes bacterium]|nr:hypothetical protein [Planctomycetota bacterium]
MNAWKNEGHVRVKFVASFLLAVLLVLGGAITAMGDIDITIMSWNPSDASEVDFQTVPNGEDYVVAAIQATGTDIAGLVEQGSTAADVASTLGWYYYEWTASRAIVSKYPIVEALPGGPGGYILAAKIRVSDSPVQDIIVTCGALSSQLYASDEACTGQTPAQIIASENLERMNPTWGIIDQMAPYASDLANTDNVPFFFCGDINTPSHLDWTAENNKGCQIGAVALPVTIYLEDTLGLRDAYRQRHPDPVYSPGNTWSPLYYTLSTGQDRIDVINYKGSGVSLLD